MNSINDAMTTDREQLRKLITGEEFDYQTLMDVLANFAAPRLFRFC